MNCSMASIKNKSGRGSLLLHVLELTFIIILMITYFISGLHKVSWLVVTNHICIFKKRHNINYWQIGKVTRKHIYTGLVCVVFIILQHMAKKCTLSTYKDFQCEDIIGDIIYVMKEKYLHRCVCHILAQFLQRVHQHHNAKKYKSIVTARFFISVNCR